MPRSTARRALPHLLAAALLILGPAAATAAAAESPEPLRLSASLGPLESLGPLRPLKSLETLKPLKPLEPLSPAAVLPDSAPAAYPDVLRRRAAALLADTLLDYSQVGICVYDLTADSLLLAHGARQCLRPASCQKLVTAAAAVATLGSDYRLTTTLLLDPADSTVTVRAGFDPLLATDDLRAFATALRRAGIDSLRHPIGLDLTLKDTLRMGWGWCWDDDNPPLAPLLCNGRDEFRARFAAILREAGILHPDSALLLRTAPAAPGAQPIAERSHTIQQVLQPMLKRSDNLMAEALFYHLAAASRKPYAGRREAADAIAALLRRALPGATHYKVADGSGLSLYNRTTPETLVALLRHVWGDATLCGAIFPALPIMGRDGTLRRRCRGQSADRRVWAKTGTLDGVSTLAGYAMAPNGHRLAFAVMNQGILRNADAHRFQDSLCNALTAPLRPSDIEPDALAEPPAADEPQPNAGE